MGNWQTSVEQLWLEEDADTTPRAVAKGTHLINFIKDTLSVL
jgi:hypothetical protein